jgi:hemoglobin
MGNDGMVTLYELLGERRIKKLVDAFYERVYKDATLAPIFENTIMDEVKDKQFRFLCQFLGGPQHYSMKYGHPRMRMRHMPHRIDEKAKEAWLGCMKEAIDTLDIQQELKEALYNCFPQVAQHMVNS